MYNRQLNIYCKYTLYTGSENAAPMDADHNVNKFTVKCVSSFPVFYHINSSKYKGSV